MSIIPRKGDNWTVSQEIKQGNLIDAGIVLGGTLIGIAGCALSERFGICALGIPAAIGSYVLAGFSAIKTRERVRGLKPDDVLTKTVG